MKRTILGAILVLAPLVAIEKAHGVSVEINPGPVGTTFRNAQFRFSELKGPGTNGHPVPVSFLFAEKHSQGSGESIEMTAESSSVPDTGQTLTLSGLALLALFGATLSAPFVFYLFQIPLMGRRSRRGHRGFANCRKPVFPALRAIVAVVLSAQVLRDLR